jgi:hypothetical protein
MTIVLVTAAIKRVPPEIRCLDQKNVGQIKGKGRVIKAVVVNAKSPNPNQPRRHQKARQSNDNGSLSDGAQSRTHHSSQAPEDSKVPLPWSGVDGYLPPVPQGAQSDTTHEW